MPNNSPILVTGASSFVAIHTIIQLLEQGYKVRGTVRSSSKEAEVRETISKYVQANDRLEFLPADLEQDAGWDEAMNNVEYVLHIASPFPLFEPKHEDELIIPAVQGTLRVLRAANKAKVKRVVQVSSNAAISSGHDGENRTFTEEDWTDLDKVGAYPKSKTLAERAAALGALRRQAEQETGVPKMYLANITDEVDRLCALHDVAVGAGANAVLVNALPVGLSAVRMLRRHATVPLVAHFPFIASFSRLPHYGVHTRVFTRLQRLAGYDVIIMPGLGARMHTSEQEVLDNVRACLEPMGHLRAALPVPGGSDSADTLERVWRTLGTVDFGFVPGRGVFGHPGGPRAGAASIRKKWEELASGTAG